MNTAEKLRFLADRAEDGKEFMIEGYYCKYVFKENKIKMVDDKAHEIIINTNLLDKEFSLVPRHFLTDDEKVILRNLPEQYKWIVRDAYTDKLTVFEHLPSKYTEVSVWRFGGISYSLSPFKKLFQSIQWEDEEPCEFRKYL